MKRLGSHFAGFLGLCLVYAGGVWATSVKSDNTPGEVFAQLLKEYRQFPECYKRLKDGAREFADPPVAVTKRLSPTVMQPRYKEFNVSYQLNKKIEHRLSSEIQILKKRLDNIALSDYANRAQQELNLKATTDTYNEARKTLCALSVQANISMIDAVATLPNDAPKVSGPDTSGSTKMGQNISPDSAGDQSYKARMGGRFLGTKQERSAKQEYEKLNLTPVDDQFYKGQLGKKLENDLGGRADAWSYDFEKNDLYVKVGKEVGKVTVVQDGSGVKFIRTRVGAGFVEPRGTDTKVDTTKAEGSFLLQDANVPSIFGRYQQGETTLDEGTSKPSPPKNRNHP
jgi:hypothetical protein